ncbi:MAG: anion permease [Chloroflexi bacterium]|nr:anion permease [Chloroflexota bacterium]
MSPVVVLLFAASALFAWSMGSHYTGAVMGTAYGSGVLSLRQVQLLAATGALVGSVAGSVNVIDTYAHGLVSRASSVDIAAALLAASVVTTLSTYFRLPTSTIQIYTFSLLGVALVGGLSIRAAGFGLVILFWAVGPLAALAVGYILAWLGLGIARRGEHVLTWFVVGASVYSALTLGTNDVSNAAAALVTLDLLPTRLAGLWGGLFMALGVLTWGQRLLKRIGHDILQLDVPLAATSQLSQAVTLSVINSLGHNASINQTIVGGLTGAGLATDRSKLNRMVLRNIVLNWILSPLFGLSSATLASVILRVIFRP